MANFKSDVIFRICYVVPDELQNGRYLPVCVYEERIEDFDLQKETVGLFPTLKCVGAEWMHKLVLAYREKYPNLYLMGDKIYSCYEHYEPGIRYNLLPI